MPATMQKRDVVTDTTWEERHFLTDELQEGISTEFGSQYDPAWGKCLDALMDLLNRSDRSKENDPDRDAIVSTGKILLGLRQRAPFFPPTLITREPCGGIIAEWEFADCNGDEYTQELTVYNDDRTEITVFKNGKVIDYRESGMLREEC